MTWDYWALMVIQIVVIPAVMIYFGRKFMNEPPKKDGSGFSYRSDRSVRNSSTWDFAHRYLGRLWFCAGVATAAATAIVVFVMLGQGTQEFSYVMGVMVLIHLIPLCVPLFLTERALKKNFDANGNWRG